MDVENIAKDRISWTRPIVTSAGTLHNLQKKNTHKIPRLDITLPPQLLLIDVHMPLLHMHLLIRWLTLTALLRRLRQRGSERFPPDRNERLGCIFLIQVLCVHGGCGGRGSRGVRGGVGRVRGAGDEDVGFDGGGEDAEEGVVDVFTDQAG